MIAVWALATLTIATIGSAALGDIGVQEIEFWRALPVVLLGEALIYILVLGGGLVPGAVLVLAFVLGFVFRAGIALLATGLAPRGQAEALLVGAQYYYASCWPAAAMQIILVALLLRLSRRALVRRRRPRRAVRQPVAVSEEETISRREHVMAALMEDTDAPPMSATVAEEQQIGDLGALEETAGAQAPMPPRVDRQLPFEAEAPAEPVAAESDEGGGEETDEVVSEPAEAETGEETEALEPVLTGAEEPADVAEPPGEAVPPPAALPPADLEPPEEEVEPPDRTLQDMIDAVVSRLGGDGEAQIRVWHTADQRTILAALPASAAAAEIGPEADGLIRAHLLLCAQLGVAPTDLQLGAVDGGGYAVRALDEGGALMLLLSSTGDLATGRLEMVAESVFDSLRDLATDVQALGASVQPPPKAALAEVPALSERISDASMRLTSSRPMQWRAHRRGPDEIIAVATAPGADSALAAEAIAAGADAAVALASALELGELSWFGMSGRSANLAVCRCYLEGSPALLGCVSSPSVSIGQALWDLRRLAGLVAESTP